MKRWVVLGTSAVGCLVHVVGWILRVRREHRSGVRAAHAPLERLRLYGGPRDGTVHEVTEPPPVVSVRGDAGELLSYRQTGGYEQLRGQTMADPLVRTWTYAWEPDA